MVETVVDEEPAVIPDDDEGPGWTSRWLRADPVRAVALLLIVVQLLWRAKIAFNGWMAHDDFHLAIVASESNLTLDYVLSNFNNHMMPVPQVYIWWVTDTFGYAYWPYALPMIAGQLVVSLLFLKLVRLLMRPGWGQLVPMAIVLFSPLNLETTSWWVFGMIMLPMEIAMVWAMIAQVRYARTRRWYHLVSLGLALVFGYLFTQKTLLILPLVFLLTACLLVRGSIGRSVWRTLTRFWLSWFIMIAISAAYMAVYLDRTGSSLRQPSSVDQVVTFFGQFFGDTLIPGLLGGPWNWLYGGAGPPLAAPAAASHIAAVLAMVILMVVTIWRRRSAGRAWVLFLGYAVLAALMIAATRMGSGLSDIAGLILRYASDSAFIGALCIGVAMFGLRDLPDVKPIRRSELFVRWPLARQVLTAITAGVLGFGMVTSTSTYSAGWSVQAGREYLKTAQAELAKAPEGTVFLDGHVPEDVMPAFAHPFNIQSRFFGPADLKPVFVSEAESPSLFDAKGHIRPAWVDGPVAVAGPKGDCGYLVTPGKPVTIKLGRVMLEWGWTVRMAYMATTDTRVTFRLGTATYEFDAKQGLHQIFFPIGGGGAEVQVSITGYETELCTNSILVGHPVPWLL